MTQYAVFITTPRAGLGFAVAPYTVEAKTLYATRAEAQAFADAKVLSAGVIALFDAMPPLFPAWVLNGIYPLGSYCSYDGKSWKVTQGHTAFDPAWFPGGAANLWELVQNPGMTAWAFPVLYTLPAQRTYSGTLYTLLQTHTSQSDWTPPAVPALWRDDGPALDVPAYSRAIWTVVSTDDPDYTEVERVKEA